MTLLFHIPPVLRALSGAAEVRVDGSATTVGEALALLWAAQPALRDRVQDERGQVRAHVNVFVGAESIRHSGGLATRLPDDDDLGAGGGDIEISIVPAVSGGLESLWA